MRFEWDEAKNRLNIAKHGVSFDTASRIFDGIVLTAEDRRFEYGETRLISIGAVEGVVVLAVAHTDRNNKIRLISARPASRRERSRYEQALRSRIEP